MVGGRNMFHWCMKVIHKQLKQEASVWAWQSIIALIALCKSHDKFDILGRLHGTYSCNAGIMVLTGTWDFSIKVEPKDTQQEDKKEETQNEKATEEVDDTSWYGLDFDTR